MLEERKGWPMWGIGLSLCGKYEFNMIDPLTPDYDPLMPDYGSHYLYIPSIEI